MRLLKVLIMGLPGSGKTTLARSLAPILRAVHFNADHVRATVNRDLGFSEADRLEQAYRMGCMCDIVTMSNIDAVADFVCPTPETRAAFNPSHIIWMNTIQHGRFEDTNKLFVAPSNVDIEITDFDYSLSEIYSSLRS